MRVLIVEDSSTDARIVQRYLRDGDAAQTTTASRLSQALESISGNGYDAVILDLTLPDVEGADAVRQLRAAAANVPIVILSSSEDEELASQAMQAGAQDYLIKGRVDQVSLVRAVRRAIERQQLLDRLAASEARLQEENAILRRLADAAGRVFSTLDVRAVVGLLAAEARRLWGGSVTLYALRASGELVSTDAPGGGKQVPDAFVYHALSSRKPLVDEDRSRLTLPIAGTSGRNEWVLDITNPSGTFGENDVFALELLRQYVGIAIQNVALFGELQSQRASVIQLNQLKDDLIAVLAHDFKGPLTTIIGFTELLEQHALEGEDAEGALRTIRQSAMRLASLANDTLALSRVEQGELNLAADPVNVAEIAKETVESLQPQREIVFDVRASDPVVRGDPARLRQVFENVIGNAIKYSTEEQPIEVRVTETDSTVRVAVTDRGIGIPPDEMKFLFERFTRASNAKRSPIKGTGLGLYLAKTLIERHGGNIQVQSTLGEGSTFTIVLPRMRDGLGGVLRILAVTADENLGPYLLHELRSHGYAARRDKTLTAAMERLDVEQADIVIVDRDTITSEVKALFKRAATSSPAVGLIAIGGDADEQNGPWSATLPNPFLGSDLQLAVQTANLVRLSTAKVQV